MVSVAGGSLLGLYGGFLIWLNLPWGKQMFPGPNGTEIIALLLPITSLGMPVSLLTNVLLGTLLARIFRLLGKKALLVAPAIGAAAGAIILYFLKLFTLGLTDDINLEILGVICGSLTATISAAWYLRITDGNE